MVDRDYLLKKPSGPSAPKRFLDTKIVPLAANTAGRFEVALDQTSARLGIRPALVVAGAAGLAAVLAARLLRTPAPVVTAAEPGG